MNAYTLTFAVLLLTGAALGDRFGRRRMFASGIALFTVASAAAALAPAMDALIAARAVQGVGGAIVMPLTLTILSDGVPAARRGVALGIWGGIGGIAIASGPLVGGAVIEGISWQWIFWLNVPSASCSSRSRSRSCARATGREGRLDLPGLALASAGLLGVVWGLVNGNGDGWASPSIVASLIVGARAARRVRPVGAPRRRSRCCRCASSATAASRLRTGRRSRCSSGCSARSSC